MKLVMRMNHQEKRQIVIMGKENGQKMTKHKDHDTLCEKEIVRVPIFNPQFFPFSHPVAKFA